jgi:hypothetical protein
MAAGASIDTQGFERPLAERWQSAGLPVGYDLHSHRHD